MSERDDRGIPGSGAVIAVAVVMVLLASSGVLWWKMKAAEPAGGEGPPGEVNAPAARPLDAAMPVTVYLPSVDALAAVSAQVKAQLDARSQAREIITALLSGEKDQKGPVLAGLQVREVYLDAAGTVYADLNIVPGEGIRSSAWDELLAIASITTSVTENVPEVRQVRFLVGGKEAQTLAGHVDLTRSYTGRMDLVK